MVVDALPRAGSALAPARVAAYGRDGVLFPLPLLTPNEAAAALAKLEDMQQRVGEPRRVSNLHLYFPWARELVLRPALLDAVEALLGPDLLIVGSLVLSKPPHDPAFASWHQDNVYASFGLSAWIALSDSTEESGCMRVVPGSHRWERLPHVVSTAEHNMLDRAPEIAVPVDERKAVSLILKAGEMSIHDPAIIHGSGPNRSPARRTGFVVRFATPRVKVSQVRVLRARGAGDCSHLPLEEAPPPGDIEEGIRAWDRGTRQ